MTRSLCFAFLLLAAPAFAADDPPAKSLPANTKVGIDYLLLEGGGFTNSPQADYSATLRASAFVSWRPDKAWELRAGGRLDGDSQGGGASDDSDARLVFTDTFVRWRGGDTRLTFGEQTVIWGRVDAVPLIDRVSRVDLTRGALDDLRQRRLSDLAARWEQSWEDFKLDAVVLPLGRSALLPDVQSVWSPINTYSGQVLGLPSSPQLANLVRNASISDDTGGFGGGAVRLTGTSGTIDYGATLARTRQSMPYYLVDTATPALNGIHPFNNFVGVDAEWAGDSLVWRTELGYTADVPVTLPNATMAMSDAVDWVGGVEFFPGGKDTRVNLQVLARSLRTSQSILELKNYLGLNGMVESTFDQGRWKAGLKFSAGLSVTDWYLSPSVAYVGWEPFELYLAGYYFAGAERTIGGFYSKQNMVAVGLRKHF